VVLTTVEVLALVRAPFLSLVFLVVCVVGFFATSWVSSEWVDPVLSFFSEFVLVTSVSRPVTALELEGARGDGFPAFCSLVPEGVSVASGILLCRDPAGRLHHFGVQRG